MPTSDKQLYTSAFQKINQMEQDYLFRFKSSLEHYTAEVFVLRCFDDRFRKAYEAFMVSLGINHYDPESVAGGAKIFASPEKEDDQDFMIRELEKSILLHHVKKVMLFTHHACGAYKEIAPSSHDKEAEFAFHVGEHHKARAAIYECFPELQVESYFTDEHGIKRIS